MKKLGLLLLSPLLFAVGCGGDCLTDPTGPECVCGSTTAFQVQDGNYKQSMTSNPITSTCSTQVFDPVAARSQIEGALRHVYNPGTGEVCIETVPAAGMQPVKIGCGMVKCNKGTLTSLVAFEDTKCRWTADTKIDITVTAKNTISIDSFKQTRTQWGSVSMGSCVQTTDCTVNYSALLSM